jgi:hypothetical protein
MDRQTRGDLLPMVRTRLDGETTAFARRCRQTLQANWTNWLKAATR